MVYRVQIKSAKNKVDLNITLLAKSTLFSIFIETQLQQNWYNPDLRFASIVSGMLYRTIV